MRCSSVVMVVVVSVVGLCVANPAPNSMLPRAVANPKTPNQILDAVFERTVQKLEDINWDTSKRVQNGDSEFPFQVDTAASSSERFSITKATISGLGSLRRSKSGSFNAAETVLKGTAMVEDATLNADYTVTFPGSGEAPAQTVTGSVAERVNKLFADIEINMLNGVPQSIKSYTVHSGHDNLDSATNLDGNSMAPLHTAGFRQSLREIIESTMARNMKVQINKSIQDMKNGN